MALLSVIRRWHYREHLSIREISRRTGLSRNTVRKYLRVDEVEPKFKVPERNRTVSYVFDFNRIISVWISIRTHKITQSKIIPVVRFRYPQKLHRMMR